MNRFVKALLPVLFVVLLATGADAQQVLRGVTSGVYLRSSDISHLSEWEANVVRYPLYTAEPADYMTETGYYAWLDRAMNRLDSLMPAFERDGMRVIISLHMPPGGAMVVKGTSVYRLFSEAWTQQAILVTWNKLATHYASNTTVWGFDILNEPQMKKVTKGLKDWNKLAYEIAATIRAVDSTHYIIVESVYGNPVLISRLKTIPLPGIVYSVHMYYPLSFQHQGLYGNPLGVWYPTKKLNKKSLEKILKPVVTFQRKRGVPIYIGEFSAVRWAPGNSSYLYLQDAIDLFEQYGWHWTYHAFRESDAWSVEHSGDMNDHHPAASTTDREMLLRQYLGRN